MTPSPHDDLQFLPYKLDPVARRVLWLRMDDAQRREAAFLDDRAVPANAEGAWMPWTTLPSPTPQPTADAIFHIGHCGSTLLSRLLDSWNEVQGLREPLPLRTLAEAWPMLAEPQSRIAPDEAVPLLRSLWSRWSQTLAPRTRSIVKATSSCNGLVEPLLRHTSARAVLVDMPLRAYLATLLKSPASVHDAANAAGERLRSLQSRGIAADTALHRLSLPQQCAMGWLAEQLRFDAMAQGEQGARVLRLDFEVLLADPAAELQRVAIHLELDHARLGDALSSSAWGRYSKAQSHGYGRDDRAHDLALSLQRHAAEIAEGERWVDAHRPA